MGLKELLEDRRFAERLKKIVKNDEARERRVKPNTFVLRNRLIHTMTFYFQNAYSAAGVQWTMDNDAEIAAMVDDIVALARAGE